MSKIKGLKEENTMLSSLQNYSQSEVAQHRMFSLPSGRQKRDLRYKISKRIVTPKHGPRNIRCLVYLYNNVSRLFGTEKYKPVRETK